MANKSNYPTTFIGDNPIGLEAGAQDGLGFEDYASALANLVLSSNEPVSIGIFGDWGSGKTSLMNLIKKNVETNAQGTATTVWFNAWRYESESHPIVPLCATIISAIEAQKGILGKSFDAVVKALRSIANGFALKTKVKLPLVAETEVGFAIKDMINEDNALLEQSLYYNAFEKLDKASSQLKENKIVIFIDDLDRCFPEHAIRLIESVKLVLSQPGFVFVFGLDKKTISSFVSQKYATVAGVSGEMYLDKLFQVTFFIPDYSHLIGDYAAMLVKSHLEASAKKEFAPLFPTIGSFCRNNPRAVKRFLNNILIDRAIASKRPQIKHIPLIYFGFARALQMHWPIVADAIRYNDDEICTKLSKDIYEHPAGLDQALQELASDELNVNEPVYHLILQERSLQDLITSEVARAWLSSSDNRTCWSLLQERTIEVLPEEQNENGNRFVNVKRGIIVDKNKIYSTVIRSGWCQEKVQKIFPELFSIITERADKAFWGKVNWGYQKKNKGKVLGKVVHSSGSNMYLMEFDHRSDKVYLFVNEAGIEILDG